jgi:acyl carrier protein
MTRNSVLERVRAFFEEERGLDPLQIEETTAFEELAADSLDVQELAVELEDLLGGTWVTEAELNSISTVGDAIDVVLAHRQVAGAA